MKAIVYERTGPPDVLRVVDRPVVEPGPDEVRVRIAVSGVHPTDWKARAGTGTIKELAETQVPGQDGAGTVDVVGSNVTLFAPGDRVWVWDAAFQRTEGTPKRSRSSSPATAPIYLRPRPSTMEPRSESQR